MGVALLLPITYGMEATTGIVMLLGIYCGSVYGPHTADNRTHRK